MPASAGCPAAVTDASPATAGNRLDRSKTVNAAALFIAVSPCYGSVRLRRGLQAGSAHPRWQPLPRLHSSRLSGAAASTPAELAGGRSARLHDRLPSGSLPNRPHLSHTSKQHSLNIAFISLSWLQCLSIQSRNSRGTRPLTQTLGWPTREWLGRWVASRSAFRERRLLHSIHLAFLSGDHRSRAASLCHSRLIHLPHLVRLTLSMALSISSARAAMAACCSTSISITSHLAPLGKALLLPDHDTVAATAAKALRRCHRQSITPGTSVHLHHPQPAPRQAQFPELLSLPRPADVYITTSSSTTSNRHLCPCSVC